MFDTTEFTLDQACLIGPEAVSALITLIELDLMEFVD